MTDVGNVQAGTAEAARGPARTQVQVVPLRGWPRFFLAFRLALLAYAISAGMIGFAFVRDHTRGAPLVLVVVMLVIFALDVPLVIAFTVARYSSPPHSAS